MTEQKLELCKKLLRSALIPEKDGIPVHLIGSEKLYNVNKLIDNWIYMFCDVKKYQHDVFWQ